MPQSDAYYLNREADYAVCTTVGFDAGFDSERTFLMDLLPKILKTQVSLKLVDSSKDFLSCCTNNKSEPANNKSEPGFVTPIGFPGEAVASFSGYARL